MCELMASSENTSVSPGLEAGESSREWYESLVAHDLSQSEEEEESDPGVAEDMRVERCCAN